MNIDQLFAHYEQVSDAPDAVPRLRRFVLNLAVRGRLVEQNPDDEPASELLKRIALEKARLIATGKIKKNKSQPTKVIEKEHELPKSWEWAALGTVFLYDAGIKREPETLDPNMWLLELKDIEKDTGRLLVRVQTSERKSKSTKSEFRVGDILYGKLRPYLNKVLVADKPGYSTTEIVTLRPYLSQCSEYCALALRRPGFVKYVTRLGQGTKMPRLRTQDAIVAPFPLPPLEEQHRIVAKINELMLLCDQLEEKRLRREARRNLLTTASLNRLNVSNPDRTAFRSHVNFALDNFTPLTTRPRQIKELLQTIFNLAVQGRLVEQDLTDEPASELLNQIEIERNQRVNNGEIRRYRPLSLIEANPFSLPDSWVWLPLGQTGHIFTGNSINATTRERLSRAEAGYPFIATKDVGYGYDPINYDNGLFVPTEDDSFKVVRAQSILICAEGGSAGRKIGITVRDICFGNKLLANETWSVILPQFTMFVYLSSFFYEQFAKRMTGIIGGISINKFLQLPFPLPPLKEQYRIVAKVDELVLLCNRIESDLVTCDNIRRQLLSALLDKVLEPVVNQKQVA